MLTDRLRRKSTSKKKIQIKAWYRILGTEISSYEEFHRKTVQISEEKDYTRQNENSLDSLACVIVLDEMKVNMQVKKQCLCTNFSFVSDYDSTLIILYTKSKLALRISKFLNL